jgi:hypothetical protein
MGKKPVAVPPKSAVERQSVLRQLALAGIGFLAQRAYPYRPLSNCDDR